MDGMLSSLAGSWLRPNPRQVGTSRRPRPTWTKTCWARYAAEALASILNPSGGLFSVAARPCQRPAPPFGANVALEKSRLETKTENEASSALLARLW